MPIYGIPSEVIPGFEKLITFNDDQTKILCNILSDIEEGKESKVSYDALLASDKISVREIEGVIRALVSMTDIYWDSKNSPEKFSEDFTQSFSEHRKSTTVHELETFKKNIITLTSIMGSKMRSTFKAREVIRENLNNFYESRIISDIRIVYDDSGNLDDKDQVAVIVHNLRIKYSSKPVPRGEIFISLNLEDLHQLKDVVDRAIEKDKLIRTNSHSLTFIEPQ